MKRINNVFEKVIDIDNIIESIYNSTLWIKYEIKFVI